MIVGDGQVESVPGLVIRFRTDRDTAWPDRNRQHSAEGRRRTRPAWPRTGHRPAPPQTRHGSAKCGQVIQHQRMLWTRDRMDMGHRTAMTGNDYFFARFSATMSSRSSTERAVYVPERRSKSSPRCRRLCPRDPAAVGRDLADRRIDPVTTKATYRKQAGGTSPTREI
jgi:hypothetical protein